ncbi:MAG TPA: glycoside hydrolase family 16 protein [Pirellulales bacterium]|nr:glycoside hydrolase family 16 protein [Pirellulales bacterium]
MRCLLAITVCAVLGAAAMAQDAKNPSAPASGNGATLLFASEFDSANDFLQGMKWKTSWPLGAGVTSNATPGEMQIYVDVRKGDKIAPSPFSVTDSILTITARPTPGLPSPFTYTSGCLSTAGLFSFQYGYAEIRCQAPGGKGFWPTFWMMKWTRNWDDVVWPPEVDIFQASSRINNQYYPAVMSGTKNKPIEAGQFVDTGVDISEAMHVYGFEWTQDRMTWYFDGKPVMQKPSPAGTGVRMYLMLSLAAGDDGEWIGKPDGSTQAWRIDYVRVWDRKPR